MAITKITYIGESEGGNRAAHLSNGIKYIMNLDKTEGGLWIGGNSGNDPVTAFNNFMQTKNLFLNTTGRQGYHIVLSLKPGEGTEEIAFKIGKEFCEEYLGKDYDYSFAVHNDQPHLHVHIIFNSVSRKTGLKFRYLRGDWEKYMQPITDRLTEKYGLSRLEYEKTSSRVGKSYAEHEAEENDRFTWTKIIKADIDFAISQVNSIEEYFRYMEGMGYEIRRNGHSKEHGKYVSYLPPGKDRRGAEAKKAFRDYNAALKNGYRIADIERRIKEKSADVLPQRPLFENEFVWYGRMGNLSRFQICAVLRVYQVNVYQYLDLQEKEQARVRQDVLKAAELSENLDYIIENRIKEKVDLLNRLDIVKTEIKEVKNREASNAYVESILSEVEKKDRERYLYLNRYVAEKEKELSDEDFESLTSEAESIWDKYAASGKESVLNTRPKVRSEALSALYREKRIINRILKDYESYEDVRAAPEKDGVKYRTATEKTEKKTQTSDDVASPKKDESETKIKEVAHK